MAAIQTQTTASHSKPTSSTISFVMWVKALARRTFVQEGQLMLVAPLVPFANVDDAQTELDEYSLNHRACCDRQSGASKRAMPDLRKKEQRASQCVDTAIEGTILTASTKVALVRRAIPCVQALRETALKCKKKSDLPSKVASQLELCVCSFAQQLLTIIATHLPH